MREKNQAMASAWGRFSSDLHYVCEIISWAFNSPISPLRARLWSKRPCFLGVPKKCCEHCIFRRETIIISFSVAWQSKRESWIKTHDASVDGRRVGLGGACACEARSSLKQSGRPTPPQRKGCLIHPFVHFAGHEHDAAAKFKRGHSAPRRGFVHIVAYAERRGRSGGSPVKEWFYVNRSDERTRTRTRTVLESAKERARRQVQSELNGWKMEWS